MFRTQEGLRARFGTQRIDGSHLETFAIVIAVFRIQNKLRKTGMSSITLSIADLRFAVGDAVGELVWRSNRVAEALPMTRREEIIDRKEFVAVGLNKDDETFVVHISAIMGATAKMIIHPLRAARTASLNIKEKTQRGS